MPIAKINDVHIHLGPSGPWSPDLDASTTIEQVLEFKRKNNIGKCVVFPNPSVCVEYPAKNDYIIKAAREHPEEFIPFGRVDPRYRDEAKKEIRRLAVKGVVGIKLHPVAECFRPDHPFFLPIYQEIVDCGLLVAAHSGDCGFARASHWIPVCCKFSRLKLILCHINKAAIELMKNYENVFVDTSATFLGFECDIVALDSRKILLGSDYPYVDDLPRQMEKIGASSLKSPAIENILYRNFARLFEGHG